MRERIENLAQGKFDYNEPDIELSDMSIDFSVEIDSVFEGKITLRSLNLVAIKGFVCSSTYRMKCNVREFLGEEITIEYRFDAKGLGEGEVYKSFLTFVTNGGEFNVPVNAFVQKAEIMSSLGKVKNLFHFTNLAMENFEEAFSIFSSNRFTDILVNNDRKYITLYTALTGGKVTRWTMEDFLVSVNKKIPIQFTIDDGAKKFVLDSSIKENIEIHKNTWGFSELTVETDCVFLSFDKQKIETKEFIGNVFNLEYYVNYDKLHEGNNYGKIIIHTPYQRFEIRIEAKRAGNHFENIEKSKLIKKNIYELTKLYLDYRCKKINTNPWAKASMDLICTLCEKEPEVWEYKLMKAQLLLIEKKNYEAKEIIEQYEKQNKRKDINICSVYAMYLTTFYNKDKKYTDKVAMEIKKIYEQNRDTWQYLWMCIFVDEDLNRDELKKFELLSEQYSRGCCSPVLYAEAYRIIKEDNYFLTQLDDYKLQVLWWATKNKLIDRENAVFIANMAQKEKNFREILYKILCELYTEYEEIEILTAICSMLIKGNKVENEYFVWYEKGISSDIKITRLYEYYMYAISLEKAYTLPKKVLMYFAYNNTLDYKRKAYIFENVILQRDVMPELFQSYRRYIEEFINEQIKQKHNDRRLAFIYETMYSISNMSEELAAALSTIIFKTRIRVNTPKMRNVVVVDKYLKRERVYPIQNQESYIDLYTTERSIVLEDYEGKRHSGMVDFETERIMDSNYYVKKCYELHKDSLEVNLRMCLSSLMYGDIDEEFASVIQKLIASEEISEVYKEELRQILTKYYFENYDEEALEKYIDNLDISLLNNIWKKKTIEYLIIKGMYRQAYENIEKYGFEGIDNKKLLKFVSCYIMDNGYQNDDIILSISKETFQNKKYNEYSLKYLIKNYVGSVKLMKNIWNIAKHYGMDTYELVEKIVVQMLFTNTFIGETGELFKEYHKQGARFNIATAYFTYNAYEYVMFDRIIEDDIKLCLEREFANEKQMNILCEIALIKIYSEKNQLEAEEIDIVKNLLWKYIKQGIVFEFFANFSEEILGDIGFEDKTIVEYKTKPNTKVYIHYLCEDKDGTVQDFKVEELKQSMDGVYTKIFTLFYGDSLQYYICEEDEFAGNVTKSKIVTKTDVSINGSESRYNLLNTMSVCVTMDDENTLLEMMKNYAQVSESREKLFTIM